MEQARKKADAYLKILETITEKDTLFKPILSRIKKGMKEYIKETEIVTEQLKQKIKEGELVVKEKQIDIKKIEQDLREVERNENECRSQITSMAQQIDERDDIIERLEIEIENQRRKTREMFKNQMKQPFKKKNGENNPMMIQAQADIEDSQDV